MKARLTLGLPSSRTRLFLSCFDGKERRRKCINKKIKLESFAQESNLITFISDPENVKIVRGEQKK